CGELPRHGHRDDWTVDLRVSGGSHAVGTGQLDLGADGTDVRGEGEDQLGRCRHDLTVTRGAVGEVVVGGGRQRVQDEEGGCEQRQEDTGCPGPPGASALGEEGGHGATVRVVI